MLDLVNFVIFWAQRHPIPIVVGIVGFLVLWWMLNRKSPLDRENDRVVKNLVDGAKGKYKDVRPLR